MIKLLDKKQIAAQKQMERKAEIDEGIKLAKRVDALREIQAEEEKSLASFRDSSLKNIMAEVAKATEELHEIKRHSAIISAELEQRENNINSKATALLELEDELDNLQVLLHQKRDALAESEKIIQQDLLAIRNDKIRIAGELEDAKRKSDDAQRMYDEAKSNLFTSRGVLEEANFKNTQYQITIQNQRDWLTAWESKLAEKEQTLNAKESDLVIREIQLKDKYKALEEATKHVKRCIT